VSRVCRWGIVAGSGSGDVGVLGSTAVGIGILGLELTDVARDNNAAVELDNDLDDKATNETPLGCIVGIAELGVVITHSGLAGGDTRVRVACDGVDEQGARYDVEKQSDPQGSRIKRDHCLFPSDGANEAEEGNQSDDSIEYADKDERSFLHAG